MVKHCIHTGSTFLSHMVQQFHRHIIQVGCELTTFAIGQAWWFTGMTSALKMAVGCGFESHLRHMPENFAPMLMQVLSEPERITDLPGKSNATSHLQSSIVTTQPS